MDNIDTAIKELKTIAENMLFENDHEIRAYARGIQKKITVIEENITKRVIGEVLPELNRGDIIKLYGKKTTVIGFNVQYNDALTPPQYEIILLTTGRGEPFFRSLDHIELI